MVISSLSLEQLCDRLSVVESKKKISTKRARGRLKRERRYPKNWNEIARKTKEERNYTCEICGLQCLRPEDDRSNLTIAQIGRLTANTHHIDGNGFNNSSGNLLVVCSSHHLDIHRGKKSNQIEGQTSLFDLSMF